MDDRTAAKLSSIAIKSLAGSPVPVPPRLVLRQKVKTRSGSLCGTHPLAVSGSGANLLERCEQRRSEQLQPKRIAWEKRPWWNWIIINLTPFIHDPARAQCAVPEAAAAPARHQARKGYVVCTQRTRKLGPCVWGSRSRRVAVRFSQNFVHGH